MRVRSEGSRTLLLPVLFLVVAARLRGALTSRVGLSQVVLLHRISTRNALPFTGHIRSHNEEKPFQCHWPGCHKGFARQHDCKRHEQLHTNYRPFNCEGCKKQFARMDALNRHCASPLRLRPFVPLDDPLLFPQYDRKVALNA